MELLIKRKNNLQTVVADESFVESIHIEKLVYFNKLCPYDVISMEVVMVSDSDANILFKFMLSTKTHVLLKELVHLRTKLFYICRVA